jgi:hypothetical protein
MEPYLEELASDLTGKTGCESWAVFQSHLMAAEKRTRERAQELHVALLDLFEAQQENLMLRRVIAELEHRLNGAGEGSDTGACAVRAGCSCHW